MAKNAAIAKVSSNKLKRAKLSEKRARVSCDAPAPGTLAKRVETREWRREQAEAALATSRKNERGADLVARLARGEPLDLPAHSPYVQVRALFEAARQQQVLPAAVRLVEAVPRAVELLGADRDGTHAAWFLALASVVWLRPPEEWIPGTRNARRALASLTRHLVASWPVPAVLDGAWTSGDARQRGWWLHVASGRNLRTAEGLPWALTKRAAHEALLAPESVGVAGALRWGQVLSLGGTARLARALLGTRLGRTVGEHEDFWETVIRWLVGHPLLDPAHLGPIVDYLHAQKFVVPAGATAAPQPGLTMRDRQPRALLAQVTAWHRRLAQARRWVGTDASLPLTWAASPALEAWSYEAAEARGGRVVHQVVPLLSVEDLVLEGQRLEHCVASYAWSCARGAASIWSLRRREAGGLTPLLTIEVDPRTRRVVQARRKRNAFPDAATTSLLQRWARWARLEIAAWVLDARR